MNIGDRIYYTGDMANQEGWFMITRVRDDRWGIHYDMREGGQDGREIKGIAPCQIGHEYHGHYSTRFVTEAAYTAYREQRMAELKAFAAKYGNA